MASVGPLVPFLVGSGLGYTYGLFYQWRLAKRRALTFCENYPRLMAYCLRWEFDVLDAPQKANGKELASWVIQGGLPRISNSILAANACTSAVAELHERNRQRIVDAYIEAEDDAVV
jgi:hypothetical protein